MDQPALTRRHLLATGAALGAAAVAAPLGAQRSAFPVYGKVERLDPTLDALIDADARVEAIMEGFTWSEGPLWVGGADGQLFMSDPRENHIVRWTEKEGKSIWLKPSGFQGDAAADGLREPGTNGLATGRGGLVAADSGTRAVLQIDLRTRKRTVLVDRFEGKRFNSPNDVVISAADGAIFFTDPPWGLTGGLQSPRREMDYTGVFRLGRDGKVSLIGKYEMPNGIALSPDGRTLYHTDTKAGWIVHTLDANGRSTSEKPFVADLAAQNIVPGGSDGMKVDSAGNIWASSKEGISIFTPAGRRIGIIRGEDVISNCEIGADGHLYMSSNHKVARVRMKARKIRTTA